MRVTKTKEWYYTASKILFVVAWLLCILPTFIAGWIKLPKIVTTKSETTLTGTAIIVLACCAYPLLKGVLKMLKSPSAWLILWIVALITSALYQIPHDTLGAMVAVFFTAAIGNSLGAILFWLSKEFEKKCLLIGQMTIIGGING
jgi:hypothetical protein